MGETVMILAPASAGRQKVSCGIRRAPANLARLVKKLEMLENLRSDDSEEGFVASHHGSAASNQMSDHAGK